MLASNQLQRLRLYFLMGLVWSALQANAVASEQRSPDNLDAWRIDDVSEIALRNRAEVSAADARAEAFAQRPAIVGALEDPMIAPSIDHYPFDMPDEEGEMGDGGNGRRYDWSVSVEQRFPLSRVRGHRKAAAQADAQRARALAYGTELDVVLEAQADVLRAEVEVARVQGTRHGGAQRHGSDTRDRVSNLDLRRRRVSPHL
jgi:hypothetical protein